MAKSRTSTSGSVVVRNAQTGRFVPTERKAAKATTAEPSRRTTSVNVRGVAARVTESKTAAERWFNKPNDLLGGRTPEQAVKDGDDDRVVGLLLSVAGQ